MSLQTLNQKDNPKQGGKGEAPKLHLPPPSKPVPPGHKKQSKTVPSPAPQSTPHGRKSSKETVGLPGHGGTFPQAPPKGRS